MENIISERNNNKNNSGVLLRHRLGLWKFSFEIWKSRLRRHQTDPTTDSNAKGANFPCKSSSLPRRLLPYITEPPGMQINPRQQRPSLPRDRNVSIARCPTRLELSTWSVAPRGEIEISELLSHEVIIADYRVSQVREFSRSYLIIFTHTNHWQSRIVDFHVTSLLSPLHNKPQCHCNWRNAFKRKQR